MDIGTILFLVLIGIMIDIVIIFTGGLTLDIFQMILTKKIHLHLMEI